MSADTSVLPVLSAISFTRAKFDALTMMAAPLASTTINIRLTDSCTLAWPHTSRAPAVPMSITS